MANNYIGADRLKDLNGSLVSSIMAYVFNAMTHLSVDVRLMAFKFFDLVVLNCSSSFLLYAEKDIVFLIAVSL
ncbi:hypothetical protein QJS04_geneDACA014806 [Acorus gramineus]|uniref:Pre-rRNA-processing protein Ipi1 N-terminal domain-containing protein n=1 Tax=Acorus gramineus TaxID=55184 RepID=A0AAV9BMU4_ACOGR|nr:hypothetical protein QJS04_geneDACA014806 [Acorus gramineus]